MISASVIILFQIVAYAVILVQMYFVISRWKPKPPPLPIKLASCQFAEGNSHQDFCHYDGYSIKSNISNGKSANNTNTDSLMNFANVMIAKEECLRNPSCVGLDADLSILSKKDLSYPYYWNKNDNGVLYIRDNVQIHDKCKNMKESASNYCFMDNMKFEGEKIPIPPANTEALASSDIAVYPTVNDLISMCNSSKECKGFIYNKKGDVDQSELKSSIPFPKKWTPIIPFGELKSTSPDPSLDLYDRKYGLYVRQ